jgi:predicted metal-dependent TIM-barrel fold hydrolase
MPKRYPSQRDMGKFQNEELDFEQEMPVDATHIPWIDIHQHGHHGSWNDRHEFDISGGLGVVFVASDTMYAPYRPVEPNDLRFLWDSAIRRCHAISRSHFFKPYVALGVHTTRNRTKNYDDLIEILPEYAKLEEVKAIGETGISLNTVQVSNPWPIEKQKEVVADQMKVAKDLELPFLCHTPKSMKSTGDRWVRGKTESGHNLKPQPGNGTGSSLDPKTASIDATKIDIELADRIGLPHDQLLIDHITDDSIQFVMESAECYVGFTMYGHPSHPPIETLAETIREYGADRIVVDTDTGGTKKHTPFALKEVILDLLRLDISPEEIRKAVYENPRELLGLDSFPE